HARSAANTNYNAGAVRVSAAIAISPPPSIAVTAIGLTSLKVGQALASNASVVYTLTNGTYNSSIDTSSFTVGSLPPGLTAGTALRTNNTTVTIPISGTPTTYNANVRTLTRASSIPAVNVIGATAAITPTGTITASDIERGDGAAVSGAPTVQSTAISSITVNAVTNAGATGQSVQYAIGTSSTTIPSSNWSSYTTLSIPILGTYYVFARTAANTNYNAGIAQVSEAITVGVVLTPSNLTAIADVGAGIGGRIPLQMRNTSDIAMSVTLQGTTGTSSATNPALFDHGNRQIAHQNFNSSNFTYTITLSAGSFWGGYIGTGGDVARSYTVTSSWSTIAVSATGLTDLKVGNALSGASVVYTLASGTYASTINPANFTVTGLPAGLTAGTAQRTSSTVVTIPITGTPTTYSTNTITLTRATSIPASNVSGATAAIAPTGTITASAVARGDGEILSSLPTVRSTTENSITVNAPIFGGSNGQSIEYAINTSATTTPTSGWQASTTFSGLSFGTYFVHARTAANINYFAGPVRVSAAITIPTLTQGITLSQGNPTATANVSTGASGRIPITVTNTSSATMRVTLQGTSGTSNATDPALFSTAGVRLAYQNFNSWNFTYTITLNAGGSWSGLIGTGGDVARSYTVTASFS
ncbi:MAG: hypothetical protein FWD27_03520, partial [Coriobacteriia bacterium]|nr:hypothetical protein [Coriobacteriia bacterium]